jgi:hypothetical protein
VEAAAIRLRGDVHGNAVQPIKNAPDFSGAPEIQFTRYGGIYFFFLAGAFFAAFLAAFLVAFFIESVLPKRKICNLHRSQCDSYIRCAATEVKKKMHFTGFDPLQIKK